MCDRKKAISNDLKCRSSLFAKNIQYVAVTKNYMKITLQDWTKNFIASVYLQFYLPFSIEKKVIEKS